MLTDKQKYNILRGYLGRFFVPGEVQEIPALRQNLNADIVSKRDVLFRGDREQFNSAVCFYLLCGGRKAWREVSGGELVDIYFKRDLGDESISDSIYTYTDPYLILTLGMNEASNEFFWNILNQFLAFRQIEGLRTCIYNFSRSFNVEFAKKVVKSTFSLFTVVELDTVSQKAESNQKRKVEVAGGLVL